MVLLDSNSIRNDLTGTSYYDKTATYKARPQKIIFEDSNQAYWEKVIADNSLKEIDQSKAVIPDNATHYDWASITSNSCQ
jgi:hypothetical protein